VTAHVRLRTAPCLVVASALLSACGSSRPPPDAALSPAPAHSSSAPPTTDATTQPSSRQQPRGRKPSPHQVTAAISTVRRYLRSWATQGPSRAGRYLVTSQQPTSDQGAPRISTGTVTSYRLYRWRGPNDFTLLVSMNLRFTNDPIAWSQGRNDRFVTVHRAEGPVRYRLEFATGP
jgi:hypothetical protein